MKIAEVSDKYGLSPDTLRYYERVGLLPTVTRSESGIREFSEVDIKRVEFIKCMRSAGLPVEVLTEYIALVQKGDSTIAARKTILTQQRELLQARMQEMKKTLDLLNYKIDIYETKLLDLERGISQPEEAVKEVV
jgi:MerR family transcriptional regulator, aldehyde-responsive regulator